MFNTVEEAAGYLSAMIDGEGTVTFRPVPGGFDRRVTIYNTDPGVVAATEAALMLLGISFKIYTIKPRDKRADYTIQHIYISRKENLRRLAEVTTLRSEGKRQRLEDAITSYQR